VEENKFSFRGKRVCETTMRRWYLIGLSTYLSHSPIDRKAFSAPFQSVQQANCAVQPTAGEGGDGIVSTVLSALQEHTPSIPSAHQCTRTDKRTCLVRGGRTCALNITSTVRGHPSVSLLPLSSPTLLFICIHPPHLCTILKDHIHSRRLLGPTVRRLPRSRLINSHRLPASPSTRTSTALDRFRPHWDRSAWCYGTLCCQGTPVAVPTRANICASALNKGGSGDPGARSAVGRTVRGQAVTGIYTRNHSRYYLLIVTLLA
jgi:hypothetical protein